MLFSSINKQHFIAVAARIDGSQKQARTKVVVAKVVVAEVMDAKCVKKISCTVLQHSEYLLWEELWKVHVNTLVCNFHFRKSCLNEIHVNIGG